MAAPAMPRSRRFSKAEYHRMHDMGFFIDQRVELIDGEVIDMPGPANPHVVSMDCTAEILRALFGPGYWVRTQSPLDLSPWSEPQPDLAVAVGAIRTHTATPTTALLVIEVSDTTLSIDRGRKASLYAASGIADYWIVNLVDRQVEVHRNPTADPAEPFGHGYADVTTYGPADTVSPLALPNAQISVAQLLP